eukprot:1808866-Prymnesium_polylepis.1
MAKDTSTVAKAYQLKGTPFSTLKILNNAAAKPDAVEGAKKLSFVPNAEFRAAYPEMHLSLIHISEPTRRS